MNNILHKKGLQKMKKVKVAVLGASGYAGEELLRILLRHPGVEIVAITSRKNAGEPVSAVFPRFTGAPLHFVAPDAAELAKKCDAAILALPHGLATEYAIPLLNAGVKVFDISADFRLKSAAKYKEYYKVDHPAPELLAKAVYGLPERYREQLRTADLVACAGCYPTSSILPTAPLLAAGLVSTEGIVVSSCSGVTGAGRKVDLPYIFPECNESLKAYGVVGHRHLPEIEQEMAFAAGVAEMAINFIPHLAPMNRGINSTIIMNAAPGCTLEKITEVYERLSSRIRGVEDQVAAQAVYNATNTATLSCIQSQVAQLQGLTKLVIPITSVCPEPMARYNSWSAPTASSTETPAA